MGYVYNSRKNQLKTRCTFGDSKKWNVNSDSVGWIVPTPSTALWLLHQIISSRELSEHFHTPMSQQAFQQYNLLQEHLLERPTNATNEWIVKGSTRWYSSIKMYHHMMGPSIVHSMFNYIWKTSRRLRHKIFLWLLLHDRVNTRDLPNRKSIHLENYNCALCVDNTKETLLDLFSNCPFGLLC